jgi:hypothetical protein
VAEGCCNEINQHCAVPAAAQLQCSNRCGAGIAEIDPTTGQDDVLLESYQENIADREQAQPAQEELIGSFFDSGDFIRDLDNIIFGGLNMLVNLGMPAIFATGAKTVIGFIVFIDAFEATTGRRLS